MASQLPNTLSAVSFFVGDKKRFKAVGDSFSTVIPTLDGAPWVVTSAQLWLYAPGNVVANNGAFVAGDVTGIPFADYIIENYPGEWSAFWVLNDGGPTPETLGPFKFTVREKKNP